MAISLISSCLGRRDIIELYKVNSDEGFSEFHNMDQDIWVIDT
jgi:hypothetical protein